MLFDIENVERAGWVVLRPRGDLDLAAAPKLRPVLQAAQSRDIALDLSGVDLVDSVGIGLLIGAKRRSLRTGGRLVLCALPAHLAHLLDEVGLGPLFDCIDTLAELDTSHTTDDRESTGRLATERQWR